MPLLEKRRHNCNKQIIVRICAISWLQNLYTEHAVSVSSPSIHLSVFGSEVCLYLLSELLRRSAPAETPPPREDDNIGSLVTLDELRVSRHFDLVLLFGGGPSSFIVSLRARPVQVKMSRIKLNAWKCQRTSKAPMRLLSLWLSSPSHTCFVTPLTHHRGPAPPWSVVCVFARAWRNETYTGLNGEN